MVSNRKLAFMASLDFASWQPERFLESLSNLGYDGVEWTLSHFSPMIKSQEELRKLVELTKSYGLEVSEVVVQQDVVCLDEKLRKDRIDSVTECIVAASEAGIKVINVFSGPAPWDPRAPRIPEDISEKKAWDQPLTFTLSPIGVRKVRWKVTGCQLGQEG